MPRACGCKPAVLVVPLTTNLLLRDAPGNAFLPKETAGLPRDSVLAVAQLTALDRNRLLEKAGRIARPILSEVENGMRLVLGLE